MNYHFRPILDPRKVVEKALVLTFFHFVLALCLLFAGETKYLPLISTTWMIMLSGLIVSEYSHLFKKYEEKERVAQESRMKIVMNDSLREGKSWFSFYWDPTVKVVDTTVVLTPVAPDDHFSYMTMREGYPSYHSLTPGKYLITVYRGTSIQWEIPFDAQPGEAVLFSITDKDGCDANFGMELNSRVVTPTPWEILYQTRYRY